MPTLLAGTGDATITPPVGTWLEGYGGRTSGSTGVHDDLHARALVIDDGTSQAAVVSCDLVGVDRHLTARVRELASEATGIPAAHIMVAATHTHAGSAGLHPRRDAPLFETTARMIAGAVASAHAARRPAVLKAGAGSVDSVSQNRRAPDGPKDDALRVLLFDAPDHREPPVACVVNFACHATVLYATNMEVSADYPGAAVATVRELTGAPALFLNGACGDVNPSWVEQDFAEAERVGRIVGAEASRRALELRPLGHEHRTWNIRWDELTPNRPPGAMLEPHIRVASRTVELPVRRFEPEPAYRERLARLDADLRALPAGDIARRRQLMEQITRYRTEVDVAARAGASPRVLHAEVQAIALAPGCAVLGLPGEFFAETGAAIRKAAGIEHLLLACYANHYLYYVVPPAEFARGGYEAGVAIVDETAEARILEAAAAVLREVAG